MSEPYYFKIVFHPETTESERMRVSLDFTHSFRKYLSGYRDVNISENKWKYTITSVRRGYSWADGLWAAFLFTSNTTLREVKEIQFIDESGKLYKDPILLYPCRPTAVS
ncbi:MAG: hypothetical protein WCT49_02595 [Candidatus Paceibacterota bacterium]|jgi:hypothetical protein|nr:hypothetical protein [Candidatus Paceibacterota bacterium]